MLLTAPGVQMFDADTATDLATIANDRLAELISRHPTRFAGLGHLRAAFAQAGGARDGAGHEAAPPQRLRGQHAHERRVPGRSQVLARPRSSRGARRAASTFTRVRRPKDSPRRSSTTAWTAPCGPTASRRAHARRAHDPRRRLRSLPEAQDLPGPHGRRRALLALAHRLHERVGAGAGPRAETEVEAERILQAQLRDHDQRTGVSPRAGFLDQGAGRRQRDVGHRLSVSAVRASHRVHGLGTAVRCGQGEGLSPECGAHLSTSRRVEGRPSIAGRLGSPWAGDNEARAEARAVIREAQGAPVQFCDGVDHHSGRGLLQACRDCCRRDRSAR